MCGTLTLSLYFACHRFVRLPAPEKVSAGGLKANLESLKDQVKLLNASAQVKRVSPISSPATPGLLQLQRSGLYYAH